VVVEHADITAGQVHAVVKANRAATVVLSASYDPGWTATVDGQPRPTVMVAPALVGVVVGAGVHSVVFSYGGYGAYPVLFLLALLVFVGIAAGAPLWRRVRGTHGPRGVQDMPVGSGGPTETKVVRAGPAGEEW
jgi:uncharacterized membrane protein YfhO